MQAAEKIASEQEPEIKRGTCPICGMGCFTETQLRDGIPVKVKPDRASPHPADCPRAGQALDYHDHAERVNFPLKRVGGRGQGKWQRISWDQALEEIAGKLATVRDQDGPEAVAMLGGSFKGPGDAAAWRFANLFGTPNRMHLGKNCGEAEFLSEWAVYGEIGAPGMLPVAGVTKCAILWGVNPPASWSGHTLTMLQAARRQGTKLVVIDPRRTESAAIADIWVRLRPGTDGAFAYGMLNVIINEGLYDRDFVERWCIGFDELKALVQKYTPAKVAEITWVPAAQIVEVARLYATEKPGQLSFGLGVVELGKATLSAVLGKNFLRAITGNLDVRGGQVFDDHPELTCFREEMHWERLIHHPLRTRDNVSAHIWPVASVRAMQLYLEAMAKVNPLGPGSAAYMVYPAPTCVWSAIIDRDPYPIKALITQGTNTLVALANAKRIYQAFTSPNLEMHVVMDHWMTPGAQLADYVLPASDGLERPNLGGMWGFSNVYSAAPRTIEPRYERRDDYQLWRELGNRLGQQGEWPETLEGWFDQLLTPAGVSFAELAARDLPWLFPVPQAKRYEQKGFATFSGKVELKSSLLEKLGYNPLPAFEEPCWSPVSTPELAKDYPLVMTTGGSSPFYYRSQHKHLKKLRRQHPYAMLQIHPQTAQGLGIADGSAVYVETPLGRVRQQAQFADDLHPQVVHADGLWWYPEQSGTEPTLAGVWESNINVVIPDDPDHCDYAGDNHFRGLLCRVYPVER
ncbi:MAG: molybdopterin-binding oxidoreductase [Deltaproteobacteria bacterium]|nr:molybdopterin-binding oxidoreductase [Deltaproteobacteria bacterium]